MPDRPSARGRRGHRWGGRPGLPVRVARDVLSVRQVFGEPIRTGDVTLVPVARVMGGSGYGWGTGDVGMPHRGDGGGESGRHGTGGVGSGGGFGGTVTPLGVYVVRGSDVQWQPAMDMTRVITGGQVVGAIALIALAAALRRRRHRR